MANKHNSLAHTKWLCKYHIVFTPKYRRKIIYYQYRESLREIITALCKYKGVEIIEGHLMADHEDIIADTKASVMKKIKEQQEKVKLAPIPEPEKKIPVICPCREM